ncbi:MAG TPA: FAD-binding oxidoreductase [Acidimicrobiales bacterium]|nr:FAD-binding oxidoreductase [Acidimicrobiales bacterium]
MALDDRLLVQLGNVCASVTTDSSALASAARDWWPLALVWATRGEVPAMPAVIASPASAREVADVLGVCDRARVPVTAAAGRSGVCGSSVPAFGGVVLDMTGISGILDVDSTSLTVDVLPGTFGDDFEAELRSSHDLTLGHWPQSMALSTVGGWLACRSAGQMSTRYGKIEDMVVGMEVALADGRLIRTGGRAPRAAVGPDLNQIFVGSEGTLGIITEARLRAHPVPSAERRGAWTVPGFEAGLELCRRILRRGGTPAVLRLYDAVEADRGFGIGEALVIVLDEASESFVNATFGVVEEECGLAGAVSADVGLVQRWLDHRNDVSALGALVQRGIVVDTTEIAACWSALPGIYDAVLAAVGEVDGNLAVSAHQSHAYPDGACLYFSWAGRPTDDPADADRFYREAWDAVTRTTLDHGGTLSHHHGVGINRGRFMRDALGAGFDVLVAIKAALDPNGILNPGKLGLPSPFGESPWP